MITIGIDVGVRNTKCVILQDGEVIGRGTAVSDWDPPKASAEALAAAYADAGIDSIPDAPVCLTGDGGARTGIDAPSISVINATVKGARFLNPEVNEIIDLGAEGIRAARIEAEGGVANFAQNDKCASGAGSFLETMARVLEVTVDEMAPLSDQHTQEITMDTTCVVFAESEVISLIHHKVPKEDILYAVHDSFGNKVSAIVLRVGAIPPVMMTGASAYNPAAVERLSAKIGCPIEVPEYPEFVAALGAAVHAAHLDKKEA